MNRKHIINLAVAGLILVPTIAFAQGATGGVGAAVNNLQTIVTSVGNIVKALLPIVFSLAILAFFYGIMVYVFSASTDNKKNGRNIMIWALIAVGVMASLYGIIALAQNTLGINGSQDLNGGTITAPKVN